MDQLCFVCRGLGLGDVVLVDVEDKNIYSSQAPEKRKSAARIYFKPSKQKQCGLAGPMLTR